MRLTRRHLLASVAALGCAGAAGTGLMLSHWWAQPADAPYACLSAKEAACFDALAEAVFPAGGEPALGGGAAQVARYVDALILGMVPTQRDLFRLAVHGLDAACRVQAGAGMTSLPATELAGVLRGWMVAPEPNLRGIAQSLHIFVGMAYLAHPEVAPMLAPQFRCGFGADPGAFDGR